MINIDDRLLSEADDSETYLLLFIAKHMDSSGFAFPSNRRLCELTRWNIKKLQRVKDSLEAKGLIEISHRVEEKRGQTSNGYTVLTDTIGIYKNIKGKGVPAPLPHAGVPPLTPEGTTPLPPEGSRVELLSSELLSNELKKEKGEKSQTNLKPDDSKQKEKAPPIARTRPISTEEIAIHLDAEHQQFYSAVIWNGSWQDFLDYRKSQHGFRYKDPKSHAAGIRMFYKATFGNPRIAQDVVDQTRGSGYTGLFPLKENKNVTNTAILDRDRLAARVERLKASGFLDGQ